MCHVISLPPLKFTVVVPFKSTFFEIYQATLELCEEFYTENTKNSQGMNRPSFLCCPETYQNRSKIRIIHVPLKNN